MANSANGLKRQPEPKKVFVLCERSKAVLSPQHPVRRTRSFAALEPTFSVSALSAAAADKSR
jgi:hypothetical protein